jgi:hypothetical protein
VELVELVEVLVFYAKSTNDDKNTEIHLCLGIKIYTRIMKSEKAFSKELGCIVLPVNL